MFVLTFVYLWCSTENIDDLQEVKRRWCCIGGISLPNQLSCEVTKGDDNCIKTYTIAEFLALSETNKDEDFIFIQQFLKRIYRKWNCSMNLYSHNCQHFSNFVFNLMKKEVICHVSDNIVCDQITDRQFMSV